MTWTVLIKSHPFQNWKDLRYHQLPSLSMGETEAWKKNELRKTHHELRWGIRTVASRCSHQGSSHHSHSLLNCMLCCWLYLHIKCFSFILTACGLCPDFIWMVKVGSQTHIFLSTSFVPHKKTSSPSTGPNRLDQLLILSLTPYHGILTHYSSWISKAS